MTYAVGLPTTTAQNSDFIKDEFVVLANGETTFNITQAISDIDSAELTVNGVEYDLNADYTVVGTTLTWSGPFTLQAGYKLVFKFI